MRTLSKIRRCIPSLETCPEVIQPSGKQATIYTSGNMSRSSLHNISADTAYLLIQPLPHALVAHNLVVVLQRAVKHTKTSSAARRHSPLRRHLLLLVLDPTALVAQAHELPDDALHRVREPVLLGRRVRLLRGALRLVVCRRLAVVLVLVLGTRLVAPVVH